MSMQICFHVNAVGPGDVGGEALVGRFSFMSMQI